MLMLRKICLLLFIVSLFGCEISQEQDTSPVRWYKGNLHTHSLWSDGDEYPEMIMKWYKENGYHFVGLSDHNILQEGEKWVKVPDNPIRQLAFDNYLKQWGDDWVEQKEDTAGLFVKLKTLAEYRGRFEVADSFLILLSEEISDQFDGKPIHLNATNLKELIPPAGGNSLIETIQNNIDAVHAQRDATGEPMIVHLNHPNFVWAITAEDMKALRGERFFEIYNGHPAVNNYGDSTRIGTEEMWDLVNVHYIEIGEPLMYGLAVDDSHNYHNLGLVYSNVGRGWVMVQAEKLHPAELINNMENGQFYASTGVTLSDYQADDQEIRLSVETEVGIEYQIQFIGLKKGADKTDVLQESTAVKATYRWTGEELFVRAKVISNKLQRNPFRTGDVECAWTQPDRRSVAVAK